MANLADLVSSNWWNFTLVILFVIGFFVGTIEMARALFRVQAMRMKRQREAYQYVLENYDALTDSKRSVITVDSLRLAKFKVSEENRDKIQIAIDTLPKFGHVVEEIKLGGTSHYVFGASRQDLERAIGNSH